MSKVINVVVPDIGGAADVDVIEVLVNPGDTINEGDSIVGQRRFELQPVPGTVGCSFENDSAVRKTFSHDATFDR